MRREEEVRERDILLVKTAETLLIHFAFRFIMMSIKNRFKETTTSKLTVLPSIAYPCLSKKCCVITLVEEATTTPFYMVLNKPLR